MKTIFSRKESCPPLRGGAGGGMKHYRNYEELEKQGANLPTWLTGKFEMS